MNSGAPLLEVRDLHVSYGPIRALRGVSFSIQAGELMAVVGANGAGKTTLLTAISGLLRPAGGRILFRGRDLAGRPAHRIVAEGIAHVPEGRAILGQMTVEENLELGAYSSRGVPDKRAEVEAMMGRFPILRERRHLAAGALSGGEQQQLAIARGLLQRPRLLLLDEPSMGLAPLLVNEIFRLIEDIHRQGTTILLVEQNARKALSLADHAVVLEQGEVTVSGTGRELLDNQAVVEAYMGLARP